MPIECGPVFDRFCANLQRLMADQTKEALDITHIATAAMLDATWESVRRTGIDASDPDIYQKIDFQKSIDETKRVILQHSSHLTRGCEIASDAMAIKRTIKDFDHATVRDTLRSLATLDMPPFDTVPVTKRGLACIDALKLAALEECGVDFRSNPLAIFLFNADAGYAQGMVEGWKVALAPANPFNTELNLAVHKALTLDGTVENSVSGSAIRTGYWLRGGITFGMYEGINCTQKGRQELAALNAAMNAHDGETGITLKKDKSGLYQHTRSRLTEAQMAHFTGEFFASFHQEVAGARQSPVDADTMNERLDRAALKLASSHQKLHPFMDGNGRAFSIFLLNRALRELGRPPMLIDDATRLDGFSHLEINIADARQAFEKLQSQSA
ncbi:hypothetical protein D3870_16775 [Noviherbaspirillum cavernae]|uniref:Fido domain-containing protein n=2 Tax=Noviherbaspirillum cavernae TaxID=2320862 RepID=A0A418X4U3_9BURK|nr:hypothetical protein D3870_16775 [Noviherbaspirillum cavernae]